MKHTNGIKAVIRLARKFADDAQGAVALIVGIALLAVLIGILSITVDLGRTQTSYNKNQDATDAAALGLAELILKGIIDQIGKRPDPYNWQPTQAEMNIYAENLLRQNFARDQSNATYDPSSLRVTYDKTAKNPARDGKINHQVEVYACANLVTPLSATAQHAESTRTCTVSQAGFAMSELANLEVAFALDFTNSMYWTGEAPPGTGSEPKCPHSVINNNGKCPPFPETKAGKLMEAMDYVFDTYFSSSDAESTTYASIVPYSGLVNLYPYSKSMVNQVTTPPPEPTQPYELRSFGNRIGKSENYFTHISNAGFYADYPRRRFSPLNRIPVISDASKLNNIISSKGAPSSSLPFNSYVSHYNSLLGQPEDIRTTKCYNGAILAALDQRIERLENPGKKGIIVTNDNAKIEGGPPKKYPPEKGADQPLSYFNGNREYELHESFPIQPLTNNVDILKNTVNRFTATSLLYNDNFDSTITPNNTVDRQSNILNKSSSFSATIGTSSIHGLLWSWFTVNSQWKDRWSAASLSETFFPGGSQSQSSRAGLPKEEHIKHIILMTDGHDNDGNNVGSGKIQSMCDAYSPTGAVSDSQYNDLCSAIKEDGVKVHILLLGFNQTGTSRYSNCAGSKDEPGAKYFYNNVQPGQIQEIMNDIFKTIIKDLTTVQLIK